MKVFAMDTSSQNASVAVIDDNKILGEFSVNSKNTHSQTIMPMTDELLKKCGLTLKDIDVFAVCTGPGSFTGVRIGMSAVKTLCQALSKPIIGVTSLDTLSSNFECLKDVVIAPVIDARGGNVYNALYLNGEKIENERVININSLVAELDGKNTVFCGDGIVPYRENILSKSTNTVAPSHLAMQSASSVAFCALKRANLNDYDNFYSLLPVYLRKSQAERELEEKLKQE